MDYLCKCLNCSNTLIDENPQIGAIKHQITNEELHMIQIEENGEVYWACPVCNTDNYLVDL